MKLRIICTSAAAIALCVFPAFAQNQGQAQAVRVHGVIESFDGQVMQVRTDEGKMASVTVPANLQIRANANATLADIKPGDFVASAADKGADGKVHAEEVRIFPEAMRGAGEGHRPMGPDPNRTMTNGTVAMSDPEARTMTNGTVSGTGAAGARSITVQYKEGETVITVDPGTPITKIVIADKTLLTPGATVSVTAAQKDGGLVATNLTAEKDGVKPR